MCIKSCTKWVNNDMALIWMTGSLCLSGGDLRTYIEMKYTQNMEVCHNVTHAIALPVSMCVSSIEFFFCY